MNEYKTKKTEQLAGIWEAQFGLEFTNRKLEVHESERRLREPFWSRLVKSVPDARTYLEVGCNVGLNLEGIWRADEHLSITGIEPNDYARGIATEKLGSRATILNGNIFHISSHSADIVITCSVLIHVAPNDLHSAMENLYCASNRYILTMEYYWPVLKEIEYRGLRNALWKQDFGFRWLERFDLQLLETGYLDARDGFDRITYWLLKKDTTPIPQ